MNRDNHTIQDAALTNALEKARGLEASIIKIEQDLKSAKQELSKTKDFISAWYGFAGVSVGEAANGFTLEQGVESSITTESRGSNPKKETVVAVVMAIILETGHPVSRNFLFDRLKDAGIRINGKDPKMILSTMLWRSKDLVIRLDHHGYWLTSHPYAPAGYDPYVPNVDLPVQRSVFD